MRWSVDEDRALVELVTAAISTSLNGLDGVDWAAISKRIPGRSSKQCRERWSGTVDPGLNKTPLTAAQSSRLDALIDEHGTRWNVIASAMGTGHSELMLRNHYYSRIRKAQRDTRRQEAKAASAAPPSSLSGRSSRRSSRSTSSEMSEAAIANKAEEEDATYSDLRARSSVVPGALTRESRPRRSAAAGAKASWLAATGDDDDEEEDGRQAEAAGAGAKPLTRPSLAKSAAAQQAAKPAAGAGSSSVAAAAGRRRSRAEVEKAGSLDRARSTGSTGSSFAGDDEFDAASDSDEEDEEDEEDDRASVGSRSSKRSRASYASNASAASGVSGVSELAGQFGKMHTASPSAAALVAATRRGSLKSGSVKPGPASKPGQAVKPGPGTAAALSALQAKPAAALAATSAAAAAAAAADRAHGAMHSGMRTGVAGWGMFQPSSSEDERTDSTEETRSSGTGGTGESEGQRGERGKGRTGERNATAAGAGAHIRRGSSSSLGSFSSFSSSEYEGKKALYKPRDRSGSSRRLLQGDLKNSSSANGSSSGGKKKSSPRPVSLTLPAPTMHSNAVLNDVDAAAFKEHLDSLDMDLKVDVNSLFPGGAAVPIPGPIHPCTCDHGPTPGLHVAGPSCGHSHAHPPAPAYVQPHTHHHGTRKRRSPTEAAAAAGAGAVAAAPAAGATAKAKAASDRSSNSPTQATGAAASGIAASFAPFVPQVPGGSISGGITAAPLLGLPHGGGDAQTQQLKMLVLQQQQQIQQLIMSQEAFMRQQQQQQGQQQPLHANALPGQPQVSPHGLQIRAGPSPAASASSASAFPVPAALPAQRVGQIALAGEPLTPHIPFAMPGPKDAVPDALSAMPYGAAAAAVQGPYDRMQTDADSDDFADLLGSPLGTAGAGAGAATRAMGVPSGSADVASFVSAGAGAARPRPQQYQQFHDLWSSGSEMGSDSEREQERDGPFGAGGHGRAALAAVSQSAAAAASDFDCGSPLAQAIIAGQASAPESFPAGDAGVGSLLAGSVVSGAGIGGVSGANLNRYGAPLTATSHRSVNAAVQVQTGSGLSGGGLVTGVSAATGLGGIDRFSMGSSTTSGSQAGGVESEDNVSAVDWGVSAEAMRSGIVEDDF